MTRRLCLLVMPAEALYSSRRAATRPKVFLNSRLYHGPRANSIGGR